jgi:hypothetical protein
MSPYTCYPRLIFYPARETSEVRIHVVLVNSVQTFAAVEKRRVDLTLPDRRRRRCGKALSKAYTRPSETRGQLLYSTARCARQVRMR